MSPQELSGGRTHGLIFTQVGREAGRRLDEQIRHGRQRHDRENEFEKLIQGVYGGQGVAIEPDVIASLFKKCTEGTENPNSDTTNQSEGDKL